MSDAILEIENLFAIKRVRIKTSQITVLVGPQASGKSIISKVIFFCRGYLDDLMYLQLESGIDRRRFNQSKADSFYELFPGADGKEVQFEIRFSKGDFGFSISKSKLNRRLSIKLSDSLEASYNKFSMDYKRFVERVLSNDESDNVDLDTGLHEYRKVRSDFDELVNNLPETLYVPAARAFFSTLQNNVFRFLSEGGNFDPILVQFGRIYELYRMRKNLRSRVRESIFEFDAETQSIIRARYERDGTEDFLKTDYGRVNIRHSSSGQQEALPLIFALHQFPVRRLPDQMLILEEPEAHLFPRAQRKVVSLLSDVSLDRNCKMLVTTHSPYILACLNNEHKKSRGELSLSAYYVHDGIAEDLYDQELGIIDAGPIDSVSEEIFDEYVDVSN